MNKKERNSERNKIVLKDDLRWLKYSQYMCIVMVVLFLVYFSFLVMQNKGDVMALFNNNLFVTIGFIISACSLYIWSIFKKMRAELANYEHIDSNHLKLIIIGVAELVLFNFAALIMIIISLVKYFNWEGFKEIFKGIKRQTQTSSVVLMTIILGIFIFLTYLILFTALTL